MGVHIFNQEYPIGLCVQPFGASSIPNEVVLSPHQPESGLLGHHDISVTMAAQVRAAVLDEEKPTPMFNFQYFCHVTYVHSVGENC